MKKNHTIKVRINEKEIEAILLQASEMQIEHALLTKPSPTGTIKKLTIKGDASEMLDNLIDKFQCKPQAIFSALELLHDEILQNNTKPSPMTGWLKFSKRSPRDGQDEFYGNVFNSLTKGKIGLCEASTGSGKTTSIIAALSDVIKGTGQRGLIVTPAVSLVRDFAIEHSRLGNKAPSMRVFLGMGEFISEFELLSFLDEWKGFEEQSAIIKRWLKNGASSGEVGITQKYLKHSLRLLSADIPLEEILLRDDAGMDDGGMIAYKEQFNREKNHIETEEILLCTHAMLAVDLRTRLAVANRNEAVKEAKGNLDNQWALVKDAKLKNTATNEPLKAVDDAQSIWDKTAQTVSSGLGKLPDYHYLIVDEAHLLEQSFSNSLSSYVAIHQFTLHAKNLSQSGLLSKAALAEINSAYRSLCMGARGQHADTIQLSYLNGDIISPLKAMAIVARNGIEKISKKRLENIQPEQMRKLNSFKNDIISMNQASSSIAGQIAFLNLSPRLAYPRLFVGRASVEQYMRYLWSSIQGAACVSATLYLPKEDGYSSWYMQNILAIPFDRKQEFDPVIPKWIKDTIQVINMPSCEVVDGKILLCPSSKSDKLTDEQKELSDTVWCEEVANKLIEIYNAASGGCLVLMTSYSYVDKVKSFLLQQPHIAPNLVFAQQGDASSKNKQKVQAITINEQQNKYLQLAANGAKPIWLGLGNAWTGINLSGGDPMLSACGIEIAPELDNVLTDLIIPRIPFGINKSVTHTYRIAHKKNVPWERIDTLFRLRQGVGRLIRRFGVPKNRKIHLLDARLCEGSIADMYQLIKKAIS